MNSPVYVFTAYANWDIETTHARCRQSPQADQLQAQRYRHPFRLRSFVASRLLLRQALTQLAGVAAQDWLFDYQQQRLQLNPQQTDWHTSLSHSGEWLACVLAKTPHCGIDIETKTANPRFMAIAQRFFHVQEYQQLVALAEPQRYALFLDFWTRKEACVKAWHRGLAHHLAAISFEQSSLNPVSYPSEFAALPLTINTLQHHDWQLACAVHQQQPLWIFEEWDL